MLAIVRKNGAFKQLAYNAPILPQIKHCSLRQICHAGAARGCFSLYLPQGYKKDPGVLVY